MLDIKRGSGSFLPRLEDELELARAMIDLGANHSCPVVALLTAMDRPLGEACGNALEVVEAVDVLKGSGPADLIEVTMALGAEMLVLAEVASTREDARAMMDDAIASGRALTKFEEIVKAQSGDARVVRNPTLLAKAPHCANFEAKRGGVIQSVEPRAVGYGVIRLGGGRTTMEETVDHAVGFVIKAKPGQRVEKGQPLATIHARTPEGIEIGRSALDEAIQIGDGSVSVLPLVSHRVTARGVEDLIVSA